MFPIELSGDRVLLREVVPGDLDDAFDMVSAPGWSAWLPVEQVESRDAEAVALANLMALAREEPRTQYHLTVTLGPTGEMLGMCASVDPRPTPPRRRQLRNPATVLAPGLRNSDGAPLIDFGFASLGMHRVWAPCHPQNLASAQVLKKLGMTRDDRIRDHLFAHGRWRDSITWSILESEWPQGPLVEDR